jgi:hypothetical protein
MPTFRIERRQIMKGLGEKSDVTVEHVARKAIADFRNCDTAWGC